MEKVMETEAVNLTEKEQTIIDNLEEIEEEEQKFKKTVEEKGGNATLSSSPAVEAFRSFCITDKDLAEYINSLTEKVKQKIEDGEAKFEREALEQIYEELSEDIKKAFENSVENEIERQRESQDGEMKATMKFPPENLFRDLIAELLEKQRGKQKSEENPSPAPEGSEEVKDGILGEVNKDVNKVKDGGREIKDTLQGVGDDPSVVETGKKSEKIVNEAVKAGDVTRDEIIGDVNRDDTGSAEGETEKGGEDKQDYKSETTKRIDDWNEEKDENKKREDMKRYRDDLIEETRGIEKDIEELREELEENIGKRSDAAEELIGQLNGGAEISELGIFEREEVKKAFGEAAAICKNNLNIAELKYLEEFSDAKGNFDSLMDEHKEKEINIEQLRIMAKDMREAYEYLENIKEGEEGEAQEEVRGILGRIGEAIKNDPELQKKLIKAGLIVALFALGAGAYLGYSEIAGLLGVESTAEALEALVYGGGLVASIGVLAWKKDTVIKALKGGGKIGLGGACIVAGMFNEKNRDDFVKGVSGVGFPSWYLSWRRFLLGEENESKA